MNLLAGLEEEEYNFADHVNYEVVRTQESLELSLVELVKEKILAVDTENTGLDPHSGNPLLLQIGTSSKCYVYPAFIGLDFSPLKCILESEDIVKIFFNANYDYKWIFVKYGIRVKNIFCCQVAERLLTVGLFDGYKRASLASVAEKYLGVVIKKEVRNGFIDRDPVEKPITEKEYAYSAADVCILPDIFFQQSILLDKFELKAVTKLENDVLPVFSEMEVYGSLVDKVKWVSLLAEVKKRHSSVSKEVHKHFSKVASQKNLFGLPTFNLDSTAKLLENLSKLGFNLNDTDEETLSKYKEKHPIFKLLLDYRGYTKLVSSYGDKFLGNIHPVTGRIHAHFNQLRADCMPSGEIVLTDRGYIPVEDVLEGDQVITHNGRPKRVIASYPNGVKLVYKVSLSNGLTLRTTGNHKYKTVGGWCEASALERGLEVLVHTDAEAWSIIPEWEDFEISTWGRVRSLKTGRVLKLQKKNKWGHLKVTLYRNNAHHTRGEDRKDFSIHRLVLAAFKPESTDREVRHLNDIAWDNTIQNIVWGTGLENKADAVRYGSLNKRTSNHGQNKISEEVAAYIRSYPYTRGVSDLYLSEKFGICKEHVGDIRRGRRWYPVSYEGKKVEFHTSHVISVEVQAEEMTYGLTVEDDHSHVTGGIVTHNTGRASSSSPNLQQVPGFDEDDPDSLNFRSCFIARPGYVLVTADFSQQELRILADYSDDPVLRKAYTTVDENGNEIDVHTYTASVVFNIPYDKVGKKSRERKIAKMLNFLLVYGGGAKTLSERLGIDEEEAQVIIDDYFRRYAKIKAILDRWANFAVNNGYSVTISGRRRNLPLPPQDHPDFEKIKSSIKRKGKNNPIQGSGSDVTKKAMVIVYRAIRSGQYDADILMAVHDELVVEVRKDQAEKVKELVEEGMKSGFSYFFKKIPMKVDANISDTWEK